MERIVTIRLEAYFESNNILDKEQEGFRHFCSTTNALLTFVQSIFNRFNQKESTVAVFIDLEKAFNSVWREGLLVKLAHVGVKGKLWTWINTFLSHREAHCVVNKFTGNWFQTGIGHLKGSVISPILFNVFIKDIFSQTKSDKIKFADDGNIWITGKEPTSLETEIQKDLESIHKWTKKWRINMNIEKNEYCVFSRTGMIKDNISISLNRKSLEYNPTPKILGLTLDEKLTFSSHINILEQKVSRTVGILRQIKGIAKIS